MKPTAREPRAPTKVIASRGPIQPMLFLVFALFVITQARADVNISGLLGNEREVSVAINPWNSDNIVAFGHSPTPPGSGKMAGFGINIFVSLDGGQTWTLRPITHLDDGVLGSNVMRFDPSITVGADGTFYLAYGSLDSNNDSRLFCGRSTDGGISWDITAAVLDPGPSSSLDKWMIATGPSTLTVDQENVYIAYSRVTAGTVGAVWLVSPNVTIIG